MSVYLIVVLAVVLVTSYYVLGVGARIVVDRILSDRKQLAATTFSLSTWLPTLGAVVLHHKSQFGRAVSNTGHGLPPTLTATLVTSTAMTLTILVGYRLRDRAWAGHDRPDRAVTQAPYDAANRRIWLLFGVAVFLAALLLEAVSWGLLPLGSFWILPGAIGILYLYNYAILPVRPIGNKRFQSVREPTDRELERIRESYEQFGRAPGRTVIYSGEDSRRGLQIAGTLAGRYVWIDESLLERTDPATLAAALAIHDAQADLRFYSTVIFGQGILLASVATGLAMLVLQRTLLPSILVLFAGISTLLVALWVAGRISSRAESFARSHVGNEAVDRAYNDLGAAITLTDLENLGPIPLPKWASPETPTAWQTLRIPARPIRRWAPPPERPYWPIVGSSLLAPIGLLCTELLVRIAHSEGIIGTTQRNDVLEHFVVLLYVLLLVTPLVAAVGLRLQRQAAGPGEWSPHVAYYTIVLPFLSPVVSIVYLVERVVRTEWFWRPADLPSRTSEN